MGLYQLKVGKGGSGLEPFNTETGQYEKIGFDFEGNQIDGWESLRDLMLDMNQKDIYANADQAFKDEVDNYIKDQYNALLKEEVGRLNRDYARKHSGVEFYQSVDEMTENVSKFITDDVISFINKKGSSFWTDDSRTIRSIAFMVHKTRYANQTMNKISRDEFDEKTANLYNIPDVGWSCDQSIENDYLKTHNMVKVYRGVYCGNKTPADLYNEYCEGLFTGNDSVNGTATILGDCSGMYGSAIYMTTSEEYAGGYDNGFFLDSYIENLNSINIYFMEDETDSSGRGSELYNEMKRKKPIISAKIKNDLLARGYSLNEIMPTISAIESGIDNDFGFCCMLMGYDAFTAEGHQLDILNPSIVNVRGDK